MSFDAFILNTAVADLRSREFSFTEKLVGEGGLAKCATKDMPNFTQQQYRDWIDAGLATAGGPGNTAPLLARAGLRTAVGVNLGTGRFGSLDAQGRFFYDIMVDNNVDMSQTFIHPNLPTGTTFIYQKQSNERGGLAYFPNANNDFDFRHYRCAVEHLNPKIVFYMYSGLSDRGDANGGKDLADFMRWCKGKGAITTADSHTLAGNCQELIEKKLPVAEYGLLEPLLSVLDVFFTSFDEARMIENTLGKTGMYEGISQEEYIVHFLEFLVDKFWGGNKGARLFGVTVKDGAFVVYRDAEGNVCKPTKITSKFMVGSVVDLVGAGDSFRAGFTAYLAKNVDKFKSGKINIEDAVGMANLFASLYVKAPLNDRYGNIGKYDKMYEVVCNKSKFNSFDELVAAVK